MLRGELAAAMAAIVLAGVGIAQGAPRKAYVSGPGGLWEYGRPDGHTANTMAMDTAFGAGGWDWLSFDRAVTSGIFVPGAYDTLYLDGGDGQTPNFMGFVDAHRADLEAWVAGGGALILNAARWFDTSDFDLGFGVTLIDGASSTAKAADPNHSIFLGPHGAAGSSFTGLDFSHDYVTGSGLSPLIEDALGNAILAETGWGDGWALFGGMAPWSYQYPQPQTEQLRANILSYAASLAGVAPLTTKPGDTDKDGDVDADDYIALKRALGMTEGATWQDGDSDGDGDVDRDDFIAMVAGSRMTGLKSGVSAVPEPTTACLLALGGLAILRRKRR